MPRLAFAQSFWDGYDTLEKPVRAGVRKAMAKFQAMGVAELNADKGLHLESVEKARDPRMRTIRITDFWRGVVLAPDDGSGTFLLVNVLPHDDAYTWAAKRLYSANSATRALEVRDAVALDELTPLYETAARTAPRLLFADVSDGALRELGIDDQVLRAARSLVDKAQLEAFSTLLPEDQLEVLQYLAEGFGPEEVYRDVVAVRQPADAPAEPVEDLATVIANTPARIRLVTGPQELEEVLEKPFAAWRVFLHPSQRRVAHRTSYGGPVQVTGDPHQRIYDSRVSLGSLGIATAGRSFRLRVNYRSTEEILAWSARLLAPVTVDALEGEGTDSLAGYRSLLHGRRPHAQGYATRQEETEALVDRVRGLLDEGLAPHEIGVCARFNLSLDTAEEKLKAAGIPVLRVKGQAAQGAEGVRLATMHAMKGLEFRAVSVLGVGEGAVPFAREITPREADPLQHDADLLRERCLLFVACTRAREALSVTWSGAPSPFLPHVA